MLLWYRRQATTIKKAMGIAYLSIGLDAMLLHTVFESDPTEQSEDSTRLYLPEPFANTAPAAQYEMLQYCTRARS